ncbi:uncharacterized protein LOC143237510 [Tachypleus tridentatus]|uniref:uncharacterized protein LOC143237510 n=1 Tax=Tachypleus tridentatus TaxID=6853 RepID=UPI003FD4DB84
MRLGLTASNRDLDIQKGRPQECLTRTIHSETERLVSMATKLLVKSVFSNQQMSETFQPELSSVDKRSILRSRSIGHYKSGLGGSVKQRSLRHRPSTGSSCNRRVKKIPSRIPPHQQLRSSQKCLKNISKLQTILRPMKDSCTQTENENLELSSGNSSYPGSSLLESPVTCINSYISHSCVPSIDKSQIIFHPEHLLSEGTISAQRTFWTSDDSDHETTSSSDVQETKDYGEELIHVISSNGHQTYTGKTLFRKKRKSDIVRKTGRSQAGSEMIGGSQKVTYEESNDVGSEESTRTKGFDDTSDQRISEHGKSDQNWPMNETLKHSSLPSIQTQKKFVEHENLCSNTKEAVLVPSNERLKQGSAPDERTSDDLAGFYSSDSTETSGECTTASSETSGECTTTSSETPGECTTTSSETSEECSTTRSNCESFIEEDPYTNFTRTDKEELLCEETSSECDSCCSCCQVTDEEDSNEVLSLENVVHDTEASSDHHPETETKNESIFPTSRFVSKSTSAFLAPPTTEECDIMHTGKPIPDELENTNPEADDLYRQLSEEEFVSTLKIHEAAKSGDLHVIKLLLKNDHKRTETVDERGWTPIHLAAAHGHVDIVKFLALEGADIAALDPSGYTAMHLAAMNGYTNCVEVLLGLGCEIEYVTSEGFTPLHLAVLNAHVDCCNLLLSVGANIMQRDALNRTVHDMAEEYSLDEISELLVNYCKKTPQTTQYLIKGNIYLRLCYHTVYCTDYLMCDVKGNNQHIFFKSLMYFKLLNNIF